MKLWMLLAISEAVFEVERFIFGKRIIEEFGCDNFWLIFSPDEQI
jgi:hypothetical protein